MRRTAAALMTVLAAAAWAGSVCAQQQPDTGPRLPPDRPKAAAADGLRGAAGGPAGSVSPPSSAYGAGALIRPTVTAPTRPYVAPVRARDTRLASPGLIEPAAPRLKPWGKGQGGGGSQCRTACSSDHYVCLAQDGGDCTANWSKCVAGCPEQSAGDL